MNPPDVFDASGRLYPERRHHSRRATDFDPDLGEEIERGFARWARLMFVHRGKVMATIGLLGGVGGFLVGYIGRLHDLDSLTGRVARLETVTTAQGDDIKNLKSAARLQSYILCLSVPSEAPSVAREKCQAIITEGLTP